MTRTQPLTRTPQRHSPRRRGLPLVIAAALLASGAASAQVVYDPALVRVYPAPHSAHRTETGVVAVSRQLVDLDNDGLVDAVVTMHGDMEIGEALDAIADARGRPLSDRTGTPEKDVAADIGLATRDAAGVASTDRVGERYNPALKSRTLEAQRLGTGDVLVARTVRAEDAVRSPIYTVAERDTVYVGQRADLDPAEYERRWADPSGRPQVLGVGQEWIDHDGDGIADMAVTFREELDLYPALDAIADARGHQETMTGTRAKDAAVVAGIATRQAAAVATTDRPGERYNPAMKSRALHAHTGDGKPQPDDEAIMAHRRDLLSTGRSTPDHETRVTQFDGPVGVQRRDDRPGTVSGTAEVAPVIADVRDPDEVFVEVEDPALVVETVEPVLSDYERGLAEGRRLAREEQLALEGRIAAEERLARERADETVSSVDAPVIVNEQQPADAFAPTAGSTGFSDGWTAEQAQDAFLRLDRDGDALLDRSEVPTGSELMAQYEGYDLDGDGRIARNEFQSWFAATGQTGRDSIAEERGEDFD